MQVLPLVVLDDEAAEGDQISEVAPSLMNMQYKHFCFSTKM